LTKWSSHLTWTRLIVFLREQVIENRVSPPFVIVSQPGHVESVTNWLIESNYFGLDAQKVQSIVLL